MRLMQAKSWCALVVLIGSVALTLTVAAGIQCSHRVANAGTDLRSILALRVALFTAPGHDPHRPPSVIASWATTLDRVLGACWLVALADNRSSAGAAPPEQTQCCGRFSRLAQGASVCSGQKPRTSAPDTSARQSLRISLLLAG